MQIRIDEKKLDRIFAKVDQCHLPGVAAGVAVNGIPVYRKGFGLASMDLPLVLTPTTRMRIYSITKHFVSLAYLLLCEQGKAALDDPIGKYLPELHPAVRSAAVRQLMVHTSGLRDVFELYFYLGGGIPDLSCDELVNHYRHLDQFNVPPETAWCYNNGGYLLLSAAIECIEGQPLEEVLRKRIFEPVGMPDTLLRRSDTDFLPNSATMHMTTAGGGYERIHLPGERSGEGGIVSTVNDMLRWLAHMDRPSVGSPDSWRLLKTPLTLANGLETGYGLGLIAGRYCGAEVIHHAGGGLGANALMLKVSSAGLDVIVISNRHDVSASELACEVVNTCVVGLEARKDARSNRLVHGIFRSAESGHVLQLYDQDGEQQVSINGGEGIRFQFDQDALRPIPALSHWMLRLMGDPDHPSGVRFEDHGRIDQLQIVPPSKGDPHEIVGRYRTEAGIQIVISAEGDQVRLDSSGPFGSASYQVECLTENLWRFRPRGGCAWPGGGILAVSPGRADIWFMTGRTWNLALRREALEPGVETKHAKDTSAGPKG